MYRVFRFSAVAVICYAALQHMYSKLYAGLVNVSLYLLIIAYLLLLPTNPIR